jgi:hypothetical protein
VIQRHLSQRDLVDFCTFVSFVFVVIKLAVTVLPWHARVAAVCMIAGWLPVEALVALLHVHELSELDMTLTVERAADVRQYLWGKEFERAVLKACICVLVSAPIRFYSSLFFLTYYDELPLWASISLLASPCFAGPP